MPYACDRCGKTWPKNQGLKRHQARKKPCTSNEQSNLQSVEQTDTTPVTPSHNQSVQNPQAQQENVVLLKVSQKSKRMNRTCNRCGKIISTPQKLSQHLNRKFPCKSKEEITQSSVNQGLNEDYKVKGKQIETIISEGNKSE